jgi:glycosyltransferase involved in cell wall biosynthesis
MRVLILAPEYDGFGGGIMTFYRGLAPALRSAGVELRVIEGSAFHAAEKRDTRTVDGVAVQTLEKARLVRWWARFRSFAATPGLRRHLAAAWAMWEQADFGEGCDIVEACDWGLLFVPPTVEMTRPLVVQCHGSVGQIADHDPIAGEATDNLLVRLIERDILSSAQAVQSYSLENAKFWRAETGRGITTILPAWSRPDVPEPQEHSDRGLVVGRLQRWKGPAVLCEGLQQLGGRAPCVDWVGRDTVWGARESSTAEHLARSYPDVWRTKLIHHAPISPEEVARRQASALFNIVPSTWDMFNFTVVEAMASGRPAIVSIGAGASELIEDGVNGYLFANENADALAGAIERVLSENPVRLSEIGREAQNTIRTALNPKAIAVQRIAAYRAAIDAFNAKQPAPVGGWLGAVCRPSETLGNDMTFLENLPLRALAKHVVGRISRRIRQQ